MHNGDNSAAHGDYRVDRRADEELAGSQTGSDLLQQSARDDGEVQEVAEHDGPIVDAADQGALRRIESMCDQTAAYRVR